MVGRRGISISAYSLRNCEELTKFFWFKETVGVGKVAV